MLHVFILEDSETFSFGLKTLFRSPNKAQKSSLCSFWRLLTSAEQTDFHKLAPGASLQRKNKQSLFVQRA